MLGLQCNLIAISVSEQLIVQQKIGPDFFLHVDRIDHLFENNSNYALLLD